MNRKTFALLFFVRRTKLLSNGEVPVYLRITVDGSRSEFSINRSIKEVNWDPKRSKAKGKKAFSKQRKDISKHKDIIAFRDLLSQTIDVQPSHSNKKLRFLEKYYGSGPSRVKSVKVRKDSERLEDVFKISDNNITFKVLESKAYNENPALGHVYKYDMKPLAVAKLHGKDIKDLLLLFKDASNNYERQFVSLPDHILKYFIRSDRKGTPRFKVYEKDNGWVIESELKTNKRKGRKSYPIRMKLDRYMNKLPDEVKGFKLIKKDFETEKGAETLLDGLLNNK